MKLTNLVSIKGYSAGLGGNLLVSLDDKLVQDRAYATAKKDYSVRMLICTARVEDPAAQEELRKHVDAFTPVDRVIVVSKKFMRLLPKTRLILLMNENSQAMIEDEVSSNYEAESFGHVETMANFGVIRSSIAFSKARKLREKDERRAGSACKRFYRKTSRQLKKEMGDVAEELEGMTLSDIWDEAENLAEENVVADVTPIKEALQDAADNLKAAAASVDPSPAPAQA